MYPVYADTTVMSGKTGTCQTNGYYEGIIYMPCTKENGFIPELPTETPDLIFLCYRITSYNVCYTKLLRLFCYSFLSPFLIPPKGKELKTNISCSKFLLFYCHIFLTPLPWRGWGRLLICVITSYSIHYTKLYDMNNLQPLLSLEINE